MATLSMKEVRGYVRQKAKEAEAWGALEKQLSQFPDLDKALADKRRGLEKLDAEVATLAGKRDSVQAGYDLIISNGRKEVEELKSDVKTQASQAKKRADDDIATLAKERASVANDANIASDQRRESADILKSAKDDAAAMTKREVALSAREAGVAKREDDAAATVAKYEAELARIRDFAKGVNVA